MNAMAPLRLRVLVLLARAAPVILALQRDAHQFQSASNASKGKQASNSSFLSASDTTRSASNASLDSASNTSLQSASDASLGSVANATLQTEGDLSLRAWSGSRSSSQAATGKFFSKGIMYNPFAETDDDAIADDAGSFPPESDPDFAARQHLEHAFASFLTMKSNDGIWNSANGSRRELTKVLPPFEHLPQPSGRGRGSLSSLFRGMKEAAFGEDLEQSQAKSRPSVWVHGYCRSGSSTVMTMFSEAWPGENVFSQFEPCHRRDRLNEGWENKPCGEQIMHYAACDYSFVKYLHGWGNRRSTQVAKQGWMSWTRPGDVADACSRANAGVFKTISHPFESYRVSHEVKPYLQLEPRLRFIEVVRDPRSIYASMLTTEPFRSQYLGRMHDSEAMTKICDSFALNVHVYHPRIFRLVFEDLLDSPVETIQSTYTFLDIHLHEHHLDWMRKTLNARSCSEEQVRNKHYQDCHTSHTATSSRENWRKILNLTEQAIFLRRPSCRMVAMAYNYSLAFYIP